MAMIPGDDAPLESRSRRRARRGEGERLREEILDAGERLLLETGSAASVSIRAIGNAVGVTAPSIYRHFADKASLIYSICERHFARLHAHTVGAIEGIDDPVEAIRACGRAYFEFAMENPEPYRVLIMSGDDGVPMELERTWVANDRTLLLVGSLAQQCLESGRVNRRWTDAGDVALALWAQVHGITSLAISKPFLDVERSAFVDAYLDTCISSMFTVRTASG